MSVTLTRDATNLTLPDPLLGRPVSAVRRQTLGRTAGGEVFVYDKGAATYETEWVFTGLSGVDKAALASFFTDTVQGARLTFTATDGAGVDRTARFLDRRLSFVRTGPAVWSVRCRLELSNLGD